MKAIQTGNVFRIYDNSMKTYERIPAQAYLVNFHPQQGFYLTVYSDIQVSEKVYGVHEAKVNKVMNAFHSFNRNLGVILSGDKGIGKSLFAKLLAATAIKDGLPLIIVNSYYAGIGEYLNDIEQEVMILFDEFDKTFASHKEDDPQAEMLTLFDGIAQGKKLFVVTCNDLKNLNGFLVNRPGRFHYHFRFEYPNDAAITEYLEDKLDSKYYKEISSVVSFSKKVPLNYDCLRAIAFELNCGETFSEAIADLNIIREQGDYFTIILQFDNGEQLKMRRYFLDMFSEEEQDLSFEDSDTYDTIGTVTFTPADNIFNTTIAHNVIAAKDLTWQLYPIDTENSDTKAIDHYNRLKDAHPEYLIFHRNLDKNIHYKV